MVVLPKPGEKFQDWPGLAYELRNRKIQAFLPGEREYELSAATANLLYRYTRPFLVVQPESWADVFKIVERAYKLKLHKLLTVKCGGHSYTGFSTVDQGIVVDLKRMTEVEIEYDANGIPSVAVVQSGARWADVYRQLLVKQCRGYVVNGGRCPGVGVGGFLLGAGLGPFGRTLGMGSDTILSFSIITLQGGKVAKLDIDGTSEEKSEKDLFWALKGGGSSAFGIVTEFRLKVCRLSAPNPDLGVAACRYVWPVDMGEPGSDQEKHFLATMNKFYAAKWPKEMCIDSNWMLDSGALKIRWTVYYDGPDEECDRLLDEHILDEKLKQELKKRTIAEPSTRFLHETLWLMWEEEARLSLPKDMSYQLYCSFVFSGHKDKSTMEDIIKVGLQQQRNFKAKMGEDKASMWITYIHSGGKVSEIDVESSAYPWREGVFQTSVTITWTDKWLEKPAREALLAVKQAMGGFSEEFEGQCASYVNFSDATLAVQNNEHAQKAYYGQHSAKLIRIKMERDPEGFFNWPWETDTQSQVWDRQASKATASQGGDVKAMATNGAVSTSEDGLAALQVPNILKLDEQEIENLAKQWTDKIAGSAWDSYQIPPPAYGDLYAPDYVTQ